MACMVYLPPVRIVMLTYSRLFGLLILPMLTLMAERGHGQTVDSVRTLQGTVLDGSSLEPVPGALVVLLSTDSTGAETEHVSTVTNAAGAFRLPVPDGTGYSLRITSLGFDEARVLVTEEDRNPRVWLTPESTQDGIADKVSVTAVRRTRSVEDGCCRVESIREEVQQHAPFSPSPVESLRRYSSCTSGRIINAIDGAATVSLRGLEPTRVGLALDDAPVFTGLSRFYGLGLIPSHALQTIRITEGASDARYGNGVVSGMVNLETRPPTEEPELNASLSLSGESVTPDQTDLNVSYTGLIGDVGLAAFASYNRHNLFLNDLGGTLDRDYERASGIVKGNILLDNLTELTLTVLGGDEHREGLVTSEGESNYSQQLHLQRLDGILSIARMTGESGELLGTAGVSRVGASGTYGRHPLSATQTIAWGELRYTGTAGSHAYAAGVQGRSDVLTDNATAPVSPIDYSVSILSAYAQDAVSLGGEWGVLGSVRLDRHSGAGMNVAPRGSIRFSPTDAVSMRLMAGGGLKGEVLFDEEHGILTGAYRWIPNADLRYERSWTINYDISWETLVGTVAGLNTNLNAYYALIDGRHIPQPDSLAHGVFFPVNDDEPARLTGLEWQTRGTIGENWSGSFALSLIDYTTIDPAGERVQVPLAPRLNVDASVTYRDEEAGLIAEVWGNRIGSQRLPEPVNGVEETSSYVVLNGRIEKTLGPVAIFAGLLNGLNERQTEVMPLILRTGEIPNGGIAWGMIEGREFFAGVRVRW